MFTDYGLIHRDLIDKVDWVTYEVFGYWKGKGDHRGWYFDIQETDLFGNEIDGLYQSKGWSLHRKHSRQLTNYIRAVDRYLTKQNFYQQIAELMKSKRDHHKEEEAIDEDITQASYYGE